MFELHCQTKSQYGAESSMSLPILCIDILLINNNAFNLFKQYYFAKYALHAMQCRAKLPNVPFAHCDE